MLILAGITISLVMSDNGIFNKAQNAKNETDKATQNEISAIEDATNKANDILAGTGISSGNGSGSGSGTGGGNTPVTLPVATGTTPYLPNATTFAQVAGTNLDNGLVIEDSNGNQYVWVEVPRIAAVYPTSGTEITENAEGKFTDAQYTTIENDLKTYTTTYRNGTSYADTWYADSSTGWYTQDEYNNAKKAMLKSVYQNGGFWVGRYETGIASPRTANADSEKSNPTTLPNPIIKANVYPYNYITRTQAKVLAERLTTNQYTCSLMFGVQWDLVLKYLETKGTSQADLKTNSISWGNYKDNLYTDATHPNGITNTNAKSTTSPSSASSWTNIPSEGLKKTSSSSILLTTGSTDIFSKQNIYDIAGNVWEWTLEYTSYTSAPCAYRGGAYNINGSNSPASDRGSYTTSNSGNHIGVRFTLYK